MSQQSGFAGGAAWMGDGGVSPDRVVEGRRCGWRGMAFEGEEEIQGTMHGEGIEPPTYWV